MNIKQIKILLIEKDLTIIELAEMVGVNRCYLSRILHGHRKGKRIRRKIAEILDIEFKEAA